MGRAFLYDEAKADVVELPPHAYGLSVWHVPQWDHVSLKKRIDALSSDVNTSMAIYREHHVNSRTTVYVRTGYDHLLPEAMTAARSVVGHGRVEKIQLDQCAFDVCTSLPDSLRAEVGHYLAVYDHLYPEIEQWWQRAAKDVEERWKEVMIVRHGGRLAGVAIIKPYSRGSTKLQHFSIATFARGQGLGRVFLGAVMRRVLGVGCELVQMTMRPDAIREFGDFYAKAGFQRDPYQLDPLAQDITFSLHLSPTHPILSPSLPLPATPAT